MSLLWVIGVKTKGMQQLVRIALITLMLGTVSTDQYSGLPLDKFVTHTMRLLPVCFATSRNVASRTPILLYSIHATKASMFLPLLSPNFSTKLKTSSMLINDTSCRGKCSTKNASISLDEKLNVRNKLIMLPADVPRKLRMCFIKFTSSR